MIGDESFQNLLQTVKNVETHQQDSSFHFKGRFFFSPFIFLTYYPFRICEQIISIIIRNVHKINTLGTYQAILNFVDKG